MNALPKPARHLSTAAKKLFNAIVGEYQIDDSAGVATLTSAVESWDRAREAREQIDKEGLTFRDRFGQVRSHPAVTVERDSRAAFLSGLKALDLQVDGQKAKPGRPTDHELWRKRGKL